MRTINKSAAAVVASSVVSCEAEKRESSFVSFEVACERLPGLAEYLDSVVTQAFIARGVVDPETMTFREDAKGWEIQNAFKKVWNGLSDVFGEVWDSVEKTGTLILPGTEDCELSAQEAAAIQGGLWGSKKTGQKSIFWNNYFVMEAKRRHQEYMKTQDYTVTGKENRENKGNVSTNLGEKMKGVEVIVRG